MAERFYQSNGGRNGGKNSQYVRQPFSTRDARKKSENFVIAQVFFISFNHDNEDFHVGNEIADTLHTN